MLSGCLVDDPPPFITPQKTEPRLLYSKATPGLDQVIVRNSGDKIDFHVPVKSEDAGDPLVGNFFLDYLGDARPPVGLAIVSASTLDDPDERALKTRVNIFPGFSSAGCHRITLRVTHLSNLVEGDSYQLIDKTDLAEAFWFANIDVAPEAAGMLVDCPMGSSGAR